MLWCPSDPVVADSQPLDGSYGLPAGTNLVQYYTSYGGCQGMWSLDVLFSDDARYGPGFYSERLTNMNGLIFSSSSVKLAEITDGTSNTILFAERPHGKISNVTGDQTYYHWWNSGYYTDAMCETFYPLNSQFKGLPLIDGSTDEDWVMTVGSYHPGGPTSASPMDRSGSSRNRSSPSPSTHPTAASRPSPTAVTSSR